MHHGLTALLALVALSLSRVAHAAPPDALVESLGALVDEAELGDDIGLLVADVSSGETWFSLRPDVPRNPASNMKLLTAATVLTELGPSYEMRTLVYGNPDDVGRVSTLLLVGEGDPALDYGDLLELGVALRERGIRQVDTIQVDGSFFDDQVLPPAFDQQPHEIATFRAPVGAVSVDRNSYVLRIVPGPAVDAPASVLLRAPGYFDVESAITTSSSGAPNVIADQRSDGRSMRLRLHGSVPMGVSGVSYRRRIADPLAYAGFAFAAALERVGMKGKMRVQVGPHSGGLSLLAAHDSPTIATHLQRVGKYSDNFVAETLLKVVDGKRRGGSGSTEGGLARSKALLESCGVDASGVTLVNASGLFDGNLIAPSHVVGLLRCMYRNPSLRSDYVAQLAVGGRDGTLRKRLRNLPVEGIVRAKTGTLNAVIGLSGYLLGPTPNQVLAFSFLFNGVAGKQWKARALSDDLLRELADALHGE